jgi:hypothetical protein
MAIRPLPTISDIPENPLGMLASFMGQHDLLAFRKTSRAFRAVSAPYFEVLKNQLKQLNQLFVDRYGSRTACEKDIPLKTLIRRAESFPTLDVCSGIDIDPPVRRSRSYDKDRYAPQNLWLEIDPEGIPRLSNYQVFFRRTMSVLELLKTEYQFYRGDFHQVRDTRLLSLLNQQNEIDLELVLQPLNSNYPLQDLRNRMRRLQTLFNERTSLLCAMNRSKRCYQTFLGNLGIIKRVLFFVISYFHSFYQKAYTGEIEGSHLPPSFNELNNRGVPIGETKITFCEAEIPVVIKAKFGTSDMGVNSPYDFSAKTILSIFRKNDQNATVPSLLGSIEIIRIWSQIRPNGTYYPYYSEAVWNAGKDVGTLQNRRLVSDLHDNLGQDSKNGDCPLMRLMTQIALEVFQLEPDKRLEITSHHCDADVFIAGGFSTHRPSTFDAEIKADIRTAREANRLFPAYRDLGSFTVYIEKSSSPALTRFVTRNEKDEEQPALVDFDFDHPPITWEEQMNTHRLLTTTKGPILPKFFTRDPSLPI